MDQAYFDRIEAVDYTIKHDDGIGLSTIDQAEIILLGVSRTSKTPTSIYMAYRGWKVANIPLVIDQPIPSEVFRVDQKKVVALTINCDRLQLIRMERERKLRKGGLGSYTDPETIEQEVAYGMRLYRRHGWPVIDVTYKSIEETATEAARVIFAKMGARKGKKSDVLTDL